MNHSLTMLPWDSDFFKFKVGKFEGNILSKDNIISIESIIAKNGFKLTYCISEKKIETDIIDKAEFDWILADRKLVYTKQLDFLRPTHSSIQAYNNCMQITDKLISLSVQSGVYSRCNIDKNIGRSNFEKLYQLWMENSLNKKIALEVLLFIENNQLAGFVTLGEKNGRADIGIIAVEEKFRGRGIGKELMLAAENWFQENGYCYIQVVTQGDNKPACALYERLGYQLESENYFYHIWNNTTDYKI